MKHIKTFESFLNEGTEKDPDLRVGASVTIEMDDEDGDFSAGDYQVIGLTRGGVIMSGMGKNKLEVSIGALNDAGYTVNESMITKHELNELALSSTGVQGLLHAIYYNWDKIKDKIESKFYFKSFRDVIQFIKSGDQEEQRELENAVKSFGIEIVDLDDKNSWDLK